MDLRFAPLCFFLCFYSCHSPEKLLHAGRYDEAIKASSRNLQKPDNVHQMEQAFNAAQSGDLKKAELLATNVDNPNNWVETHACYLRVQQRQYDMAARMPIRSRDGYSPKFEWLEHIDTLEFNAREKAAHQLYFTAELQLEQARKGDKQAARQAYQTLQNLTENYAPVWRESAALMDEALRIGTNYVLVEQDQGFAFHGWLFLEDLNLDFYVDNQRWVAYHTEPVSGIQYQSIVRLTVEALDVGMENREEITHNEEKDIQTDVIITYDSSGHVIGRTPVYKKIQANVKELVISKNSRVALRLEWLDAGDRSVRFWDSFVFEHNFSETWIETSGDVRALSYTPANPKVGIPGAPGDWTMVSELANNARQSVLNWLSTHGAQD